MTPALSLICICKQKTFSPVLSINSSQKDKKLYLLKLPNRTSSPTSCISATACLISCEISLFVTAANREGIFLATYVSLVSLARRNWRWISEQCRIFTDWVANQSAQKTHPLFYTNNRSRSAPANNNYFDYFDMLFSFSSC